MSLGKRCSTPPMRMQQTAAAVSPGIPTSQGSQYLAILPPMAMSQGCTNSAAPISSHALYTGSSSRESRFVPSQLEPIWKPGIPSSVTARLISSTARAGACRGRVPRATNRVGCLGRVAGRVAYLATVAARSLLMNLHRSRVSSGLAWGLHFQQHWHWHWHATNTGTGTHPVAEHDGHGGEGLHGDTVPVHLLDPLLGAPAVRLHRPEEGAVLADQSALNPLRPIMQRSSPSNPISLSSQPSTNHSSIPSIKQPFLQKPIPPPSPPLWCPHPITFIMLALPGLGVPPQEWSRLTQPP